MVHDDKALREHYLDPLLGRNKTPATTATDTLRGNLLEHGSLTGSSAVQPGTSHSKRPLLDVPSLSRGTQNAPPSPIAPANGSNTQATVRSHLTASSSMTSVSVEHLPIAARFARRTSIDSVLHSTADSRTYHVNHTYSHGTRGHREVSGSTTKSGNSTGQSSSRETHATSLGVHHGLYGESSTSVSRLSPSPAPSDPMFSNPSASTSNMNAPSTANTNVGTIKIPKAFRHHLKSLVPPPPNKLHKASIPNFKAFEKDLPLALPEELRKIFEVTAEHILQGHTNLSEKLRARYGEQYRESALSPSRESPLQATKLNVLT